MLASFSLTEDYWEKFEVREADLEFISHHLLEIESPLSPAELLAGVVRHRLAGEQRLAEERRQAAGDLYLPKEKYKVGQNLVLPAMDYQAGVVTRVRPANSHLEEEFEVIEIEFEDGAKKEFAAGLESHQLNVPPEISPDDPLLNPELILQDHDTRLADLLVDALRESDDFVYIAGRWFHKALLVEVNEGNLNLAEAALDVVKGGPLPTREFMEDIGLPDGVNQNLAEFSLDLALQEDERFDEVGSAGKVVWFLKRLEPEEVLNTPLTLRYQPSDYDRSVLTEQMLSLEQFMADELSPVPDEIPEQVEQIEVRLIYPHWRAGTLPLSVQMAKLFPTAYESPRIRFQFVDGNSGEKFPGWVVRLERYVHGLRAWYLEKGVMPGTYVRVRQGSEPGEVVVEVDPHPSNKEWVRTALIGADGEVVYASTKQPVETAFDQRMVVALPSELDTLDAAWKSGKKRKQPFEQVVVDIMRDLAKLNPQNHVHVSELYSALNVILRCPPGPVLALLATRPWFVHVGDLHFRVEDAE